VTIVLQCALFSQTELLDGTTEFSELELIAAKSSLIFSIIEEEESPSDASTQSLLCYLRGIDHGYNRFIVTTSVSVELVV